MRRLVCLNIMIAIVLMGCATRASRKGVMSTEMPLTVGDLSEIKSGKENHQNVLNNFKVYHHPLLQAYLDNLLARIAKVSDKPHLPYQITVLDSQEGHMFGGPGGFIYITRGMLSFLKSEAELAALIAHEISHISTDGYAKVPHSSKIKMLYKGVLKGADHAGSVMGAYGSVVKSGLKGVGKATPFMMRRFGQDEEILADKKAVDTLMKAQMDPRGLAIFLERISKVSTREVIRFVNYLAIHPPFQARRKILKDRLIGIKAIRKKKIQFEVKSLEAVHQMVAEPAEIKVESPTIVKEEPSAEVTPEPQEEKVLVKPELASPPTVVQKRNIVFQARFGLSHSDHRSINDLTRNKGEKVIFRSTG